MPIINGQFINENEMGGGVSTGGIQQENTISPLQQLLGVASLAKKDYGTAADLLIPKVKEKTADELKREKAKQVADTLITNLENHYFKYKLHKGNNLKGLMTELLTPSLDRTDPYSIYMSTLDSKLAQLAKASGDVGNIAFQEQLLQKKAFPTARDDRNSSAERFKIMREIFELPERNYDNLTGYAPIGIKELLKQSQEK